MTMKSDQDIKDAINPELTGGWADLVFDENFWKATSGLSPAAANVEAVKKPAVLVAPDTSRRVH